MNEEIAILMDQLAPDEDLNATSLPSVNVHKSSSGKERVPLCYRQGIYIVGNGLKHIYLGGNTYTYGTENYLVLTVPLPAECNAVGTPENPLLGMMIDIDLALLNEIINELESTNTAFETQHTASPLFVSKRTVEIQDAVLRLLRVLQSPSEARIIGPGIVREIWYRVMCGENASSLYSLTTKNSNIARIDRALKQIHNNYGESMDIDSLASMVHMSPSAFHRTFKVVTSTSPIQYIKRIRLDKARTLLTEQGRRVNEVAHEVGYESTPQFSREFKRIFGFSPVEAGRR